MGNPKFSLITRLVARSEMNGNFYLCKTIN